MSKLQGKAADFDKAAVVLSTMNKSHTDMIDEVSEDGLEQARNFMRVLYKTEPMSTLLANVELDPKTQKDLTNQAIETFKAAMDSYTSKPISELMSLFDTGDPMAAALVYNMGIDLDELREIAKNNGNATVGQVRNGIEFDVEQVALSMPPPPAVYEEVDFNQHKDKDQAINPLAKEFGILESMVEEAAGKAIMTGIDAATDAIGEGVTLGEDAFKKAAELAEEKLGLKEPETKEAELGDLKPDAPAPTKSFVEKLSLEGDRESHPLPPLPPRK
jgi:hypothetical protein